MATSKSSWPEAHGDPARRALETWLELWAAELQVLGAWQQSVLAMQRGFFDVWVAHFAGGVPIDA